MSEYWQTQLSHKHTNSSRIDCTVQKNPNKFNYIIALIITIYVCSSYACDRNVTCFDEAKKQKTHKKVLSGTKWDVVLDIGFEVFDGLAAPSFQIDKT